MGASTMAQFIEQAWNDHADDPGGVAARLDAAHALLVAEPDQVGEFARLAEHLFLAHLGDVDAMERWLARLAPMVDAPDGESVLSRPRLAARLLRGDAAEADKLALPTVIRAHGTANRATRKQTP